MNAAVAVPLVVLGLIVAGVAGWVVFAGIAARMAGQAVPPVGRYATVDGVRLHYVDEGSVRRW